MDLTSAPAARVAGIGSWSATVTAVSSVAFIIGALGSALLWPSNGWSGDAAAYSAAFTPWPMVVTVVPSLVIAPAFVALIASIHLWTSARRRQWTLVALAGATVYAAIVVTNYYLQLTLVRSSIEAGHAERVALLLMDNKDGAFWPIESLAYGIQGLAAGAAALAFGRRGLERAIRWSLLTVGFSGVLSLIAGMRGVDLTDPLFILGGGLWGIALPASAVLCAIAFRACSSRSAA